MGLKQSIVKIHYIYSSHKIVPGDSSNVCAAQKKKDTFLFHNFSTARKSVLSAYFGEM